MNRIIATFLLTRCRVEKAKLRGAGRFGFLRRRIASHGNPHGPLIKITFTEQTHSLQHCSMSKKFNSGSVSPTSGGGCPPKERSKNCPAMEERSAFTSGVRQT
jgi:hypothetical protein